MTGRIPTRGSSGRLIDYFGALSAARQVLWCYLIWYAAMAAAHFDPAPSIWFAAAGLAVFIGLALLLGVEPSPRRWSSLDRWVVARLFMIPFCVSSFSALVKGKGFIAIFSPVPGEDVVAALCCGAFVAFCAAARRRRSPGG